MIYIHAIVRTPGKSLVNGLSTANLGLPDYPLALAQHKNYIAALEQCGLQVEILPAEERYPDATFLEDVALLTPWCAIVLSPGAPSRRGETEGIDQILSSYYDSIFRIQTPGTVEGGDILQVDFQYYIGITTRTNRSGAEQVVEILRDHQLDGILIPIKDLLHLKTGLAYLENQTLLACGEFVNHPAFRGFTILEMDESDAYAANCLNINGTVILPAGYPRTEKLISKAGYPIITVDVSEFRKLDGGLSCLSLRF